MVDPGPHYEKKKPKRNYKAIPKNSRQRNKRDPQKHLPHREISSLGSHKRGKLKSWKEFCTLTTSTNPWNVVYKLATNKLKASPTMTTI